MINTVRCQGENSEEKSIKVFWANLEKTNVMFTVEVKLMLVITLKQHLQTLHVQGMGLRKKRCRSERCHQKLRIIYSKIHVVEDGSCDYFWAEEGQELEIVGR